MELVAFYSFTVVHWRRISLLSLCLSSIFSASDTLRLTKGPPHCSEHLLTLGALWRPNSWFTQQDFQTRETPHMAIKHRRYTRFGPTVWCPATQQTHHTNRFHSLTFRFQMGNLSNPLEVKREFRVIPLHVSDWLHVTFNRLRARLSSGNTSHGRTSGPDNATC
ncbi:hypothetical protein XENOCAPTIV_025993 [Xenoophorus captivus]|uniref:Secreted protein n=1 Tax=Xenoophorus captivus TaxID=1517983 RepID=A0ABV0SHE5_9TELE